MAYATTNQLKNEVGIDTADVSQDSYLQDLLDRVTDWIETYTNTKFSGSAVTVTAELHDYRGNNKVWLRHVNVKSVTAVRVGQVNPVTLDSSAYQWNYLGRLIIWNYVDLWPTFPRTVDRDYYLDYISVDYTYGGDGVPKAIEGACVAICARIYRNSSIKREKLGDLDITFQDNKDIISTDELGVLDAYKVRRV